MCGTGITTGKSRKWEAYFNLMKLNFKAEDKIMENKK